MVHLVNIIYNYCRQLHTLINFYVFFYCRENRKGAFSVMYLDVLNKSVTSLKSKIACIVRSLGTGLLFSFECVNAFLHFFIHHNKNNCKEWMNICHCLRQMWHVTAGWPSLCWMVGWTEEINPDISSYLFQ